MMFFPIKRGFKISADVSLSISVNCVFLRRENLKMVRITTRPVAADVMHFKVKRYRPVMFFPNIIVVHTEFAFYTFPEITIRVEFV